MTSDSDTATEAANVFSLLERESKNFAMMSIDEKLLTLRTCCAILELRMGSQLALQMLKTTLTNGIK